MASVNKAQIMQKIARKCQMAGITVNSNNGTSLVIENAANDLTISYVDATIAAPLGGIDDSTSPFLGIGISDPGCIKIKSAITTADSVVDILDSVVAVKLFAIICGFANNIILENSDAAYSVEISPDPSIMRVGS